MRGLIVLALVALAAGAQQEDWQMINSINSAKLTWKAGPNPITAKGKGYWKQLLGGRVDPELATRPRYTPEVINADMPDSFDARQEWPKCDSIASIKDQGNCGSCWAVSSVAAMSDRLCIASDANIKVNLSAWYVVTCCSECGDGCGGGYENKAWSFFKTDGIVTGGDCDSNEGCQPYCLSSETCQEVCTNKNYAIPFDQDKHYGSSSYTLAQNVQAIQQDLMTNGPLTAAFAVYSDFMSYSSGVYQHVSGGLEGYHAVRVIGWGTEDGVDYWLVANSWNTYWGENGLFKIRRGTNECGFEEQMSAGLAAK